MATAAIVLEAGGDEDQAIAALLHDILEDTQVDHPTLVIEFGERVADIVRDCSDTEVHPKPPWKQRKQDYLDRLTHHSADSLLVSNADKLHNARAVLSDYRRVGEELWTRFNAGRECQLWYYGELVQVYRTQESPLADDLELVVDELERLIEAELGS
jgi:(p)ppGpp synthase/HD superfamily hydrolase